MYNPDAIGKDHAELEKLKLHVNPGNGLVQTEWGRTVTDWFGNLLRSDGPTTCSNPNCTCKP